MSNPWWSMYGRDYESKTGHLTLLQHGVYFRLLNHYYMTGKPLTPNMAQLHRVCRAFADAERDAVDYIVKEFFELREDGWHNKRADEEIARSKEFSKTQSDRAKKRWDMPRQCHGNATAMPAHMPDGCHTQPQPHIKPNPPTPLMKVEERNGRLSYKSRQQERWDHNKAVIEQVEQWEQARKMARDSLGSGSGQKTRDGSACLSLMDGEVTKLQ